MAANELIGVELQARLDKLRDEFKAAGKLGDEAGKEIAIGLSRQLSALRGDVRKAMGRATKEGTDAAAVELQRLQGKFLGAVDATNALGRASAGSGAAMMNFTRQLGDVGTMAAMGAPPLQIMASQAEQLAVSFREAGGASAIINKGINVLFRYGTQIGVVTGALGALGAAWLALREPAERAKAAFEITQSGASEAAKSADRAADALLRVAVAEGKITGVDADKMRASAEAVERQNEALEPHVENLRKARAQQADWTTGVVDFAENIRGVGLVIGALTTSSEEAQQVIDAETTAINGITRATRDEIAAVGEAIVAEDKAKKAREAEAKAARAAEKALRKLEEARKAAFQVEIDNFATSTAALARLDEITEANREAMRSEEQRAAAIYATTRAEIERQAVTAIATGGDSPAAAEEKRTEAIYSLIASTYELKHEGALQEQKDILATTEAWAAQGDEVAAVAENQAAMMGQVAGYAQQVVGALSQATSAAYNGSVETLTRLQSYAAASEEYLTLEQARQLRRRTADAKSAAMDSFQAMQAVKMAEAAIGGAAAFVAALDDAPAPYNYILGAAALAAAGAQIATIAAQQPAFDQGGEVQPDRVQIQAQPGEYIVSKQGASAARGEMQRWNAGMSARSAPVYVVTQLGHSRMVDRYEEQRLQRNGPIAQAVYRSLTPGQRAI